jgi:UPF0755 protein
MKRILVVLGCLACLLILTAGAVLLYGSRYPEFPGSGPGNEVEITIPKGISRPALGELLEQQGLIGSAWLFGLYLRWSGRFPSLKAGRHVFRDNMSPREIADELARPPQAKQLRVTIPEGLNLREIAEVLAKAGLVSRDDFLAQATDKELVRERGIPAATFEGYLFPDTYLFHANAGARDIVATMHNKFKEVFAELEARYPKELEGYRQKLGFGEHELVILASMVEKETGLPQERGLVASVFYNRLTDPVFKPRLLNCDPTVIYGIPNFQGNLTRRHLDDASNPYNTYRHEGLPPGPIANPGQASLEAAVNPTPSRHLFFVAKGDGSGAHVFTRKWADHEQAVNRYQRKIPLKNSPK